MKFTILQENLSKTLTFLQKAIPSKPQLPILSSILLEVKDNKLTLSATDLYLGIKSQCIAQVEAEGAIVVPGDVFKQFIGSLAPGKINFELKDQNLLISAGKSKIKIPTQSNEDYPDFPQVKGSDLNLPLDVLDQIEKYVSFSASIDQTRPVLTTVLLKSINDGLEVVATDGFRLSTLFFSGINSNQELNLLVPVKALSEVYRIAQSSQEKELKVTLSTELKQIKFVIGDTQVFVRLIEGDYPPYEKIIPTDFRVKVSIDGEQLSAEIKRAFILARDASNIIKLEIKDNSLIIRSTSPAYGNYEGVVEIENMSNENGELAFNAKYLLEFLNTVKPEKIYFGMNESLKPTMITVEDIKDFKYIVMPFRVNE